MADATAGPDGLCVVDKTAGWTSHDVVARARKLLGTRKVGHAGTLDPDATGVLLLGVGRATRLLRFVGELPKSYTGEVVLGVETSTLDAAGEVTATHDMVGTTLGEVRAAAARLTGRIEQVPPMVSALKVGGRRLHELARAGEVVERAPRPVTVHRFEVVGQVDGGGPEPAGERDGARPVFAVEVDCSAGTYVRTLAADLGHALGGGAHLRNLRRTAIGPFTEADAQPLGDELRLLPPLAAVRHLPRVEACDDVERAVGHGKVLERDVLGAAGEGPWAVVRAGTDELLAVYEAHRGTTTKPAVVVAG